MSGHRIIDVNKLNDILVQILSYMLIPPKCHPKSLVFSNWFSSKFWTHKISRKQTNAKFAKFSGHEN